MVPAHMRRGKGRATKGDGRLRAQIANALPFSLTGSQQQAIAEIVDLFLATLPLAELALDRAELLA